MAQAYTVPFAAPPYDPSKNARDYTSLLVNQGNAIAQGHYDQAEFARQRGDNSARNWQALANIGAQVGSTVANLPQTMAAGRQMERQEALATQAVSDEEQIRQIREITTAAQNDTGASDEDVHTTRVRLFLEGGHTDEALKELRVWTALDSAEVTRAERRLAKGQNLFKVLEGKPDEEARLLFPGLRQEFLGIVGPGPFENVIPEEFAGSQTLTEIANIGSTLQEAITARLASNKALQEATRQTVTDTIKFTVEMYDELSFADDKEAVDGVKTKWLGHARALGLEALDAEVSGLEFSEENLASWRARSGKGLPDEVNYGEDEFKRTYFAERGITSPTSGQQGQAEAAWSAAGRKPEGVEPDKLKPPTAAQINSLERGYRTQRRAATADHERRQAAIDSELAANDPYGEDPSAVDTHHQRSQEETERHTRETDDIRDDFVRQSRRLRGQSPPTITSAEARTPPSPPVNTTPTAAPSTARTAPSAASTAPAETAAPDAEVSDGRPRLIKLPNLETGELEEIELTPEQWQIFSTDPRVAPYLLKPGQ